mgnify:CR=1 FL=1
MRIEMVCRDKPFKKVPCALVLQDGSAELTAEDGSVLFNGSYHELDLVSQFPSFSQSIKYFGVQHDGRVLGFDVPKADIQAIRSELDGQIIAADPEAAQRIARKGKLLMFGGIAMIVAGPVMSLLSYQALAARGGTYYIWYGISIFGIVILGRGIGLLRRVRG